MTDSKENDTVAVSPQIKKITSQSPLVTYREVFWGTLSLFQILLYEIYAVLLSSIGGLPGLALRSLCVPLFLGASQKLGLGRGVSLRRPAQIFFGKRNLVDDYASIEAKGENSLIRLGDSCSIGKFSIVTSKNGLIEMGNGVNISSSVRIATETRIQIGSSTLVAAYAYIGPGNHQHTSSGVSLIESPMEHRGGVTIGEHCWIGAHATIMDGVTLGDNVVVGAHSFVNQSFPSGSIIVGVPARKLN